jgi:prolipoprotein diacylglyceryltransferase
MRETIGLDMGQALSIPFVILGIIFFIRGMKNKQVTLNSSLKTKI